MDASAIAPESSSSKSLFHCGACIRVSALAVPTRHGVHWPHDSSEKNFIRLRAAALALSRSDRMITAAEPMKQSCGCSVSKSSGMSPLAAGNMPPDARPRRFFLQCGDLALENCAAARVLVALIDIDLGSLPRPRRNYHAFKEAVRVAFEVIA